MVVIRGNGAVLLGVRQGERLGMGSLVYRVWRKEPPLRAKGDDGALMRRGKDLFRSAFSGKLGWIEGQEVRLDSGPTVRPVRQKLRHIAFHLRDAVSAELDQQVREGVP